MHAILIFAVRFLSPNSSLNRSTDVYLQTQISTDFFASKVNHRGEDGLNRTVAREWKSFWGNCATEEVLLLALLYGQRGLLVGIRTRWPSAHSRCTEEFSWCYAHFEEKGILMGLFLCEQWSEWVRWYHCFGGFFVRYLNGVFWDFRLCIFEGRWWETTLMVEIFSDE